MRPNGSDPISRNNPRQAVAGTVGKGLFTTFGHLIGRRTDVATEWSSPTMLKIFKTLLRDNSGATAIEYGLIAALVAVAAVAAMTTVGTNLSTTFNNIATKL
jgi:pilus assembly protein Flp/PilA